MDTLAATLEPLIPGLRRYARAWLRDAAMADDLVQDALLRAIAKQRQLRGAELRPWLFAILHNLLIDQGRRRARRGGLVSIDSIPEAQLSHSASQEEGLHQQDLMLALNQLPEEHRAVILLVSVEGLSYEEAATILNVPTGTVMSRLSRARDRLAAMLDVERPKLRRMQ